MSMLDSILEKQEKSIEIKALCENSNVFLNTVPGKNGQKMELSLPFQSSVPATFIKLMKHSFWHTLVPKPRDYLN